MYGAHVGHDVKSRAQINDIRFNLISDDADSDTSYLIDMPEGGDCRVIGNLLHQRTRALQSALVSFAGEGAKNKAQALYFINNMIVNDRDDKLPLRIFGTPSLRIVSNLLLMRGASQSGASKLTATAAAGVFANNKYASASDFVNPPAGDYHLAVGSAAIDAASRQVLTMASI